MRKNRGVTLFETMLVLIIASLIAVAAFRYATYLNEVSAAQAYGQALYQYAQAVRQYAFDQQSNIRNLTPNSNTLDQLPIQGVSPGAAPAIASGGTSGTSGGLGASGGLGGVFGQQLGPATAPTTGIYTFTGVDWLKPAKAGNTPTQTATPYIPANFTFNNIQPARVGALPGPPTVGGANNGDASFTTTIQLTDQTDPNSPLLITIYAPLLFTVSNGQPVVRPELSMTAANYANQYYSTASGYSSISYGFVIPTNGDFSNVAIIGSNAKNGNIANEQYLRIDGQNYMQSDITMAGSTGSNYAFAAPLNLNERDLVGVQNIFLDDSPSFSPTTLGNVDLIQFNPNNVDMSGAVQPNGIASLNYINFISPSLAANPNTISNLDVLQFNGAGSTINNLQSLTFLTPSSVSSSGNYPYISNLSVLEMAGDAATHFSPFINFVNSDGMIDGVLNLSMDNGQIEGVDFINFNFGTSISGLDMCRYQTETAERMTLMSGNAVACFLTYVAAGTSCQITRSDAPTYQWYLTQANTSGTTPNCEAVCLTWAPSTAGGSASTCKASQVIVAPPTTTGTTTGTGTLPSGCVTGASGQMAC